MVMLRQREWQGGRTKVYAPPKCVAGMKGV